MPAVINLPSQLHSIGTESWVIDPIPAEKEGVECVVSRGVWSAGDVLEITIELSTDGTNYTRMCHGIAGGGASPKSEVFLRGTWPETFTTRSGPPGQLKGTHARITIDYIQAVTESINIQAF